MNAMITKMIKKNEKINILKISNVQLARFFITVTDQAGRPDIDLAAAA